jgi:hypothetical protein
MIETFIFAGQKEEKAHKAIGCGMVFMLKTFNLGPSSARRIIAYHVCVLEMVIGHISSIKRACLIWGENGAAASVVRLCSAK